MSYDTYYMWNLKKKGTNEFIYKIEIESQMQKANLALPRRMGDRNKLGDWN